MNIHAPTRPRTSLVTGGAGFLGANLCSRLLDEGNRVICVDSFLTGLPDNIRPFIGRRGFHLVEHDIHEPLDIDEPVHEIFNLACAASPPRYQADPVHTMMTSVVGTKNMLDIAERHGAAFLQASTSEIYGDPEVHPQPEDYRGAVNCTGPRACYDEGKRAAEALCFDYLRLGRADARVARIFNTYGPRMRPDDGRIVSNLICQALRGEPLTVYGSGEQTRSFCFVDDLLEGLVRLARVDPNPREPVNIGNPGEFTINELAELVLKKTGSRSRIVHMDLPEDDPRQRRPNISRARELLGWRPEISLEAGLEPTIEWFDEVLARRDEPALQSG